MKKMTILLITIILCLSTTVICYANDNFDSKLISREKFCEMIYDMLTEKTNNSLSIPTTIPFEDTHNSKVSTLYYKGIIKGKGDKVFAPNDYLTREESATILYRVAECIGLDMPQSAYNENVEYYTDKEMISEWAFNAVFYMKEIGVMIGTSETEFSPKNTYTLEQAIITISRFSDMIVMEWETPLNYPDYNQRNHNTDFSQDSGIKYVSGKAIKSDNNEFILTGDNLNHLSWVKVGYNSWYGGFYIGISMTSHHLVADNDFSSLCSNMVTHDGTRLQDNTDIANNHITISINGTPIKIKAVTMSKGNGHKDYYFVLNSNIDKNNINEITFECKL